MPWHVVKSGNGYKVKNKKTGKTYSKKPMSKKKAEAQLKAIYVNTNEALDRALDAILEKIEPFRLSGNWDRGGQAIQYIMKYADEEMARRWGPNYLLYHGLLSERVKKTSYNSISLA